ncbi:hypothetical protein IV203_026216 [Nitzschia inconspicua]|uniref:Uncharacterized protein n=1 Tax=Nitzschia inconspicua TaxID=303405 RepID=A0A9K3LL92_9STRA|nr:hypothetical protein IV203_026216 [Nitzschia inconspicua]
MPTKRKHPSSSSSSVRSVRDSTPNDEVVITSPSASPITSKEGLAKVAADALQLSSTVLTTTDQALEWCHLARDLWLNDSTREDDLVTVEQLYRAALNAKRKRADGNTNKKKKKKTTTSTSYAALSPSDYRKAGERLSLLYLQSGRPQKAKPGLNYFGFTCRLSETILNYPQYKNPPNYQNKKNSNTKTTPPACILDEFLSESQFKYLQDLFVDIDAEYWTGHDYAVEPPSPYFSYVIPIQQKNKQGSFLDSLIQQIVDCPQLRRKFPLLAKARYVEMWAHNRPHASGHQMHFDSDNEGIGGVRNPIISTILYLSDCKNNGGGVGGPSLITNQRLQSTSLSNVRGWLAYSKPRRLVAFDGTVLHGVIPGKGVVPAAAAADDDSLPQPRHEQRRVTLMLAFWKDIQLRDSVKPGAARPWPKGDDVPSWARKLLNARVRCGSDGSSPKMVDPVPIGHVYEDLDGNPLSNHQIMPEYEEVFQGF